MTNEWPQIFLTVALVFSLSWSLEGSIAEAARAYEVPDWLKWFDPMLRSTLRQPAGCFLPSFDRIRRGHLEKIDPPTSLGDGQQLQPLDLLYGEISFALRMP